MAVGCNFSNFGATRHTPKIGHTHTILLRPLPPATSSRAGRKPTSPPRRRDNVSLPSRQGTAAVCCFLCWWSTSRSKRFEHPTFDSPCQEQPLMPRAASTSSCTIPPPRVHLGVAGEHRPVPSETNPALPEIWRLRGRDRPRRRRCCLEGVADSSFADCCGGG